MCCLFYFSDQTEHESGFRCAQREVDRDFFKAQEEELQLAYERLELVRTETVEEMETWDHLVTECAERHRVFLGK
jgi:hypothetical protein